MCFGLTSVPGTWGLAAVWDVCPEGDARKTPAHCNRDKGSPPPTQDKGFQGEVQLETPGETNQTDFFTLTFPRAIAHGLWEFPRRRDRSPGPRNLLSKINTQDWHALKSRCMLLLIFHSLSSTQGVPNPGFRRTSPEPLTWTSVTRDLALIGLRGWARARVFFQVPRESNLQPVWRITQEAWEGTSSSYAFHRARKGEHIPTPRWVLQSKPREKFISPPWVKNHRVQSPCLPGGSPWKIMNDECSSFWQSLIQLGF